MHKAVMQGCKTNFLEGHSPAEFRSNPNLTHLEQGWNKTAGLRPSRN